MFIQRVGGFRGFALALVLLMGGGAAASASAQSLGDVAAREQARRNKVKTAGKVYTNEDLGPGSEAPPPAAPAAEPASQIAGPGGGAIAPPAQEQAAAPAEDPAKAEQEWRARIQGARAELQRNELFLEALQSRINALTTDFVNRDDPAQRAVIANDRQRALAEMERVKASIESLKKQIADIEEEARRANVPPGWLR
jgi:hypothetical protein